MRGLGPEDLATLACPACRGALVDEGRALRCRACGVAWPVTGGVPRLFREEAVRGTDRLMRALYDGLAALHDPATKWLLPVLQSGDPEDVMRDRIMRRVDLGSIAAPAGRPIRVLEVGIGGGANLPWIERDLPRGATAEIWGLDLSEGMMRACEARVARSGGRPVRLVMGDAHALPFRDHTFDRVFHVGALGSFRDPRAALAEMARVAVPGTPIVVADEQLDPARRHGLRHRAAFKLLTFYDRDPHCPRELLPQGARDVIEEQVSRFYYCLTFSVPGV